MSQEEKTTLRFVKMQGCGNDYIYFDCFEQTIEEPEALAVKLSDRHFGIGGDGIVLICPSDVADVKMRMFNIDGSEGKMCGNAIRCVGKYMYDRRNIGKTTITVETLSGIKTLKLTVENGEMKTAEVNMGKAVLVPKQIPVALDGDSVINRKVSVAGGKHDITCVSMGNPHCIVFGDDPENLDLPPVGPKFEFDKLFPERVNTEFNQVIDKNTLKMRVWERGSGETLACGTGSCAAVVAAVLNGFCEYDSPVTVKLVGGELSIRYCKDGTVYMTGPAVIAFDGTVNV